MVKKITIYTDGACSGNPGPGGWGALLCWKSYEKELSGAELETTNNRMELMAALNALKALKESCDVDIYTDSVYLKNGISHWIHNWKNNKWRTSSKKEVKNSDLWIELDHIQSKHKVQWHWVKGHSGHEKNERVDFLARKAIETMKTQNLKE